MINSYVHLIVYFVGALLICIFLFKPKNEWRFNKELHSYGFYYPKLISLSGIIFLIVLIIEKIESNEEQTMQGPLFILFVLLLLLSHMERQKSEK